MMAEPGTECLLHYWVESQLVQVQVEDLRPDQHNIQTSVTQTNWESVSRGILSRLVTILGPSLVLSSP